MPTLPETTRRPITHAELAALIPVGTEFHHMQTVLPLDGITLTPGNLINRVTQTHESGQIIVNLTPGSVFPQWSALVSGKDRDGYWNEAVYQTERGFIIEHYVTLRDQDPKLFRIDTYTFEYRVIRIVG